ncbi:TIGR03564 family F420-dependent LLM class oxidoreductase [Pseudonocardia dioxanivorans]|uniref:TIGR03564 family F420-dependent LLM class oxidoreductase n=1 Tax=Pseudonocardia dioxanivorans TaxID=240495 RepID=UPI000CD02DDF|nr:TIGR03564 family F420-dependent LLM class oxidoreductase [Pseudonocardia dioxanivorans]
MRISLNAAVGMGGPQTVPHAVEEVAGAADNGLAAAWLPQMPPWAGIAGWDALTVAAVAGAAVPGIGLGTSVVVAQTRHPLTLAGQALTVQSAVGNRLTLGIGVSQAPVIEPTFGYPFERPVRYLREYLEVLLPALAGEPVEHKGEALIANGQLTFPGVTAPPVVLAALGPQMLRLAGELTEGTVTLWTGVRTISEHITPRITAAAETAGRPQPRVIVGSLVCVTDDPDSARALAAERFAGAGQLPSYGAMLEIEGVASAVDVILVGTEEQIADDLRRYEEAGASELIAVLFGTAEDQARTMRFLSAINN